MWHQYKQLLHKHMQKMETVQSATIQIKSNQIY